MAITRSKFMIGVPIGLPIIGKVSLAHQGRRSRLVLRAAFTVFSMIDIITAIIEGSYRVKAVRLHGY